MARAISVNQLLNTRRKVLDFEGEWFESIGQPEVRGSMIIWGDSSQGKTSFALQFAKQIAKYERVIYNSLEEGDSLSMAEAFRREKMTEVSRRIVLLDKCPIKELTDRLKRPKSPNVIIIDSLQYSGLSYEDYKGLIKQFRNKMFVFISHADGKEPSGKVAQQIKYDAHIKVRVAAFQAHITSRYGGGKTYIISQERVSKINPD